MSIHFQNSNLSIHSWDFPHEMKYNIHHVAAGKLCIGMCEIKDFRRR